MVFVQNGKPAKAVVMATPQCTVVREFELPTNPNGSVHGQFRNARLSSRGTLLVANMAMGCIHAFARQGQTVWELNTTDYGVTQPQKTVRLKNGGHIINNWYNEWNKQPMDTANAPVQAIEVDKDGKLVWQLRAWKEPDLGTSTTIQLLDEAVNPDRLFFGEFNTPAPQLFMGPNQPVGTGRGIHPGRVAWIHAPGVASWDGKTGLWVEDRWN